ncbi:double zinc ribbon domain-containing protein, partial [bacterium]|nr:double zinc ribbon domain-containing protein [bacterium]
MPTKTLWALLNSAVDLIYPPVCACCGAEVSGIDPPVCDACLNALSRVEKPFCQTCGAPVENPHC